MLLTREDFLDTIDEPPRVSIRRRMIRVIADVACNRYHRWYVLAHSQGSVVAFNGLMETAYSWPGYLDEARWLRLKGRGMAGPAGPRFVPPAGLVMPRRPEWAGPAEIAYRSRIFSRFRGFLTYGCPLEKFAGLWPALVPISREFTFAKDVPWLNIYDPVDPVSGRLLAFRAQPPTCCPVPQNLGYAAGWLLLHAHLKYLKWRRPGDLASLTIKWLLTDSSIVFPGASGWRLANWFGANSPQALVRSWVIAWTTWILAAVLLALLGAIVLPALLDVAADAWEAMVSKIAKVATGGAEMTYWERVFLLVAIAAWVPVVLGCLAWFTFPKNPRGEPGGVQQQPTPGPFGIENDEPKPGDPDFEEFEDDPGKGRQFETQP